ncbi:espin-like protein [Alosa alosa]|uniref:espin-like protein n=1 Tax=Alosa alosa TaxID=278164 RepID=UPI00201553CC|nr:espin-like protein [Alosa alosa]
MTEADLLRIERQIENLTVMHKVTEVERELEQLEQELHQLLPVSAALNREHFSVNPKQVHGQAEDLPAWCSKISTLLKSMAILLATLGGKEIDILDLFAPGYTHKDAKSLIKAGQGGSAAASGNIGRSQSFSTREEVEKEIRQCGVSVKNLKANYEVQSQSKYEDDNRNRVYRRKMSLPVVSESSFHAEPILEDELTLSPAEMQSSSINSPPASDLEANPRFVDEPLIIPTYVPPTYTNSSGTTQGDTQHVNGIHNSGDPVLNSDQSTRSLEVQTDLSYVQECIEMRKERIVFLFLEHWRKYTISESYRPKCRSNHLGVGQEYQRYDRNLPEMDGSLQSEDDKLLYFMKQRQVVGNLLGHWRTIMSQVPTRQIRRLSRAQMIYWPEHFLPFINGAPVDYDSLTLDLFMLGYFQLLEMNMSRSERKFRHLLCYEMFDRLGSHSWEQIRWFHRDVMENIERGRRSWSDSFEDIKVKHFGDSPDGGGLLSGSEIVLPPELLKEWQEQTPTPEPPPAPPQEVVQSNEVASVKDTPKHDSPNPPPPPLPPPPDSQSTVQEPMKDSEPVPDSKASDNTTQVQVMVEKATGEPVQTPLEEPNEDSIQLIYELKEFSNEEIIRYIDRSFAFWKEKEAELFDI